MFAGAKSFVESYTVSVKPGEVVALFVPKEFSEFSLKTTGRKGEVGEYDYEYNPRLVKELLKYFDGDRERVKIELARLTAGAQKDFLLWTIEQYKLQGLGIPIGGSGKKGAEGFDASRP